MWDIIVLYVNIPIIGFNGQSAAGRNFSFHSGCSCNATSNHQCKAAHIWIQLGMHARNSQSLSMQPVIAAFRCKPDVKRHWIFKILHGILLGKVVHLLASKWWNLTKWYCYYSPPTVLNLCLGAFAMFKNSTPLLWLCVSYSAFVIIFNFSLFVLLRCVCRICNNAGRKQAVASNTAQV